MIERTKSGRLSRKRIAVNWPSLLDKIEGSGTVEVPKPPHLTIFEVRDKILSMAAFRDLDLDYIIVCGHLYVW